MITMPAGVPSTRPTRNMQTGACMWQMAIQLVIYISIADPWSGSWTDEYFGGKATRALEYGLFGTAHGITLEPHTRRLAIADRANSRIQDMDFHGTFLENVNLPKGSLPCDVDFHQGYVLIGCLRGPEGYTSAPCYVVDKDGNMLSEVNPKKDFGLELFTHIHNACLLYTSPSPRDRG